MFVLIDDLRDINQFVRPSDKKLVIRTFDEGMSFVKHTNLQDITLLMDNDLDDETPGHEGYDILSCAIDANNLPHRVMLVTSNPVARMKMSKLLEYTQQYRQIGSLFVRK
ncbi:hypothetical protein VPHD479_0355 [Vibrio phage D479]